MAIIPMHPVAEGTQTPSTSVASGRRVLETEAAALARPRIAELLGGAAPKKVIVVPDRLVNIVT